MNFPRTLVVAASALVLLARSLPVRQGHLEDDDWHEERHASSPFEYAARFPGRDIGEKVNAAVRACSDTGCIILLPPGNFFYRSTIRLDKPGVSLEGAGAVSTHLHFEGNGTGILIEEGSAPPYIEGRLADLYLDGDEDWNWNVAGVTLVDTIGFVFGDGLAIWHFKSTGDVGLLWQNEARDACGECVSGFSERTSVEQVSVGDNSVEFELLASPSSVNSFEYSMIRGLHLQIQDGQTGILVQGTGASQSAVLEHSIVDIFANIWDPAAPATFIRVAKGGAVYNNQYTLMDEETAGAQDIPYEVSDPQSILALNSGYVQLAGSGRPVARGLFVPPNNR